MTWPDAPGSEQSYSLEGYKLWRRRSFMCNRLACIPSCLLTHTQLLLLQPRPRSDYHSYSLTSVWRPTSPQPALTDRRHHALADRHRRPLTKPRQRPNARPRRFASHSPAYTRPRSLYWAVRCERALSAQSGVARSLLLPQPLLLSSVSFSSDPSQPAATAVSP
jgi:hypothetical protein